MDMHIVNIHVYGKQLYHPVRWADPTWITIT